VRQSHERSLWEDAQKVRGPQPVGIITQN
jgi:hypothetical protein